MSAIDQLIRVADEYGRTAKVDDKTVSWRLFGDSKKLPAIKNGSDIQVRRLEKAMSFLSANWPADAVWPSDILRPVIEADPETKAA